MNNIIFFIIGVIVGFAIGISKHTEINISFGGNVDEEE